MTGLFLPSSSPYQAFFSRLNAPMLSVSPTITAFWNKFASLYGKLEILRKKEEEGREEERKERRAGRMMKRGRDKIPRAHPTNDIINKFRTKHHAPTPFSK